MRAIILSVMLIACLVFAFEPIQRFDGIATADSGHFKVAREVVPWPRFPVVTSGPWPGIVVGRAAEARQ